MGPWKIIVSTVATEMNKAIIEFIAARRGGPRCLRNSWKALVWSPQIASGRLQVLSFWKCGRKTIPVQWFAHGFWWFSNVFFKRFWLWTALDESKAFFGDMPCCGRRWSLHSVLFLALVPGFCWDFHKLPTFWLWDRWRLSVSPPLGGRNERTTTDSHDHLHPARGLCARRWFQHQRISLSLGAFVVVMVCLFISIQFNVYSRWGLVQSWPVRTQQWVGHIFWKTWRHAHCHRVPGMSRFCKSPMLLVSLYHRTPQNRGELNSLRRSKKGKATSDNPCLKDFWEFSDVLAMGAQGVLRCSSLFSTRLLVSTLNWKPVVHWGLGLASSCRATHFTIDKQHSGLRVVFLNRFC